METMSSFLSDLNGDRSVTIICVFEKVKERVLVLLDFVVLMI